MLIQSTIDGLQTLKLFGMIKSLESQMDNPDSNSLCFEERLGLMVDNELTSRENKRLKNRLRLARLSQQASIEELDFKGNRGIDRAVLVSLTTSDWIRRHQNIIIHGKTGVGKSYLACALAQGACRDGFSACFERASRLFQDFSVARADGRYPKLIASIARKDLLVIDDFGLFPLNAEQRQDLLEIVEDRYSKSSTIITTQLPVEHWHEMIGDPTIADAILDRVVHNSHKLHLKGESRRKEKANAMELVG